MNYIYHKIKLHILTTQISQSIKTQKLTRFANDTTIICESYLHNLIMTPYSLGVASKRRKMVMGFRTDDPTP